MIPSSKKEELKTETTSAVESIVKNMPTKVMDNRTPFLQIVLRRLSKAQVFSHYCLLHQIKSSTYNKLIKKGI
jgi:hypothetical protein